MDKSIAQLVLDRLDKLDEKVTGKLDNIDGRINNIDVTLAKQEKEIAYHIERTDKLEDRLKPVLSHVNFMQSIWKLVVGVGAVSAIVVSALRIFGKA